MAPPFFFTRTPTTEISTLSLHDALPILETAGYAASSVWGGAPKPGRTRASNTISDRKSTRLNSSHPSSSYAVFCLKKKMDVRRHGSHSRGRVAQADFRNDGESAVS